MTILAILPPARQSPRPIFSDLLPSVPSCRPGDPKPPRPRPPPSSRPRLRRNGTAAPGTIPLSAALRRPTFAQSLPTEADALWMPLSVSLSSGGRVKPPTRQPPAEAGRLGLHAFQATVGNVVPTGAQAIARREDASPGPRLQINMEVAALVVARFVPHQQPSRLVGGTVLPAPTSRPA